MYMVHSTSSANTQSYKLRQNRLEQNATDQTCSGIAKYNIASSNIKLKLWQFIQQIKHWWRANLQACHTFLPVLFTQEQQQSLFAVKKYTCEYKIG